MKNDKQEKNNLINSKSEEIIKVLNKFKNIIDSLPPLDLQPKYYKLTNSKYDIPPDQLELKKGEIYLITLHLLISTLSEIHLFSRRTITDW